MSAVVFQRGIYSNLVNIAKMVRVSQSISTLYRKCKEVGLPESENKALQLSYNSLLPIVIDIKNYFPDIVE